ncbi:uncharacterized protein EAF02_010900 [Botrytis sinoallii]|uniref:uncharacterized protein n=1 Tax=Botrytis sinoallii TaxID=1463999 RepID=UPI001900D057|nr:uncharacterized protein EAF02_010900 [Botrytis sinoallii]KAF7859452.1 hypothetical protein EAF02_010900 [Botrytis sinoallii]
MAIYTPNQRETTSTKATAIVETRQLEETREAQELATQDSHGKRAQHIQKIIDQADDAMNLTPSGERLIDMVRYLEVDEDPTQEIDDAEKEIESDPREMPEA